MAYFEGGSEAMVALEAMVDCVGLSNVLYALAYIARDKAAGFDHNWQVCNRGLDRGLARQWVLARQWELRALRLDNSASQF